MMQAGRAIKLGEGYWHEGWGKVVVQKIQKVCESHFVTFKASSETGDRVLSQKFEDFLKATDGLDWDNLSVDQKLDFLSQTSIT